MGIIYIAFTEALVCKENPTVSALGALLTVRREVGVCPAALPPAPEPQSEWEAASARPTAPLGARGGGGRGGAVGAPGAAGRPLTRGAVRPQSAAAAWSSTWRRTTPAPRAASSSTRATRCSTSGELPPASRGPRAGLGRGGARPRGSQPPGTALERLAGRGRGPPTGPRLRRCVKRRQHRLRGALLRPLC